MTPASRKRLTIAIVSSVAVGLLVGATIAALDRRGGAETYSTSTHGERAAYYSAADLASRSSDILIATYLDSSTREFNVVSRATGLPTDAVRTDVIQRFEVVETLKGTISPGEIVEVVSSTAWREPARDGFPAVNETYDILSPVKGQQYIVFLAFSPAEPPGSKLWSFPGEPGMATLDDDGALDFLLTKGLEEELREQGKTVPFTATLDEIRAEIARQAAAPPPTPATPAPEPTPAKTVPSNP